MPSLHNPLLFLALFIAIIVPYATPQPCNTFTFPNHNNYATCMDLPVLESSLHWNYHPSSATIDVAFNKANAKDSIWISWAINPTSNGMIGSQAFVTCRRLDGTMKAYTSAITSYGTKLQEGNLSFLVHSVSASYSNSHMIIFARLQLPDNRTLVNHVWEEGLVSGDGTLRVHSLSGPNLQSFGTLDFASGKVSESGGKINSRSTLIKAHGIVNVISWGILMPTGAIAARHLKVFDGVGSTWFKLHQTCQSLAHLIGIAGFGTVLFIGNQNHGVHHTSHRCIGVALVCLASAQVCVAVFLRPKKDHKYRIFWNIFHYVFGYGTIALAILNVFKGFDILINMEKLKRIYFGTIICLAVIALVLEVISWILVCNKKDRNSKEQGDITQQQMP